jgi:PBP1b-binding outer membrane lipoprotein LpoB
MKTIILIALAIFITGCSTNPPLPPQVDKNAPSIPISPFYKK